MPRLVLPSRIVAYLLSAAWILLAAGTASAHLRLARAVPSEGSTLEVVPSELRLTFSGRIDLSLTRIELTDAAGEPVALGSVMLGADSVNVVVVPILGALDAGEYRVAWRTVGTDGHPVQGSFGFVVAAGAAGLANSGDPEAGSDGPSPGSAPTTAVEGAGITDVGSPVGVGSFGPSSPAYVAVRWFTLVCLVGLVGTIAFGTVVLRGVVRRDAGLSDSLVVPAAARARTIGLAITIVLLPTGILRLLAQGYALAGEMPDLETVAALVRGMPWGAGWLLQMVATAIALIGFALMRRHSAVGQKLAVVAALALAATPALSGHAIATGEGARLAVAADALHVLGAGGWLGTLALVVAAGLPSALRLESGDRGRAVALLIDSFSPVALACAGTLVATGAYAAALHVGSLDALWGTAYGRTLAVKIGLLAVVFALGGYNFLAVRPRVGDAAGARRLRRSAGLELAVGVAVLVVTAILVATPPGVEVADAGGLSAAMPE